MACEAPSDSGCVRSKICGPYGNEVANKKKCLFYVPLKE